MNTDRIDPVLAASLYLQILLDKARESYPEGNAVLVKISTRQRTPSMARIVGHRIYVDQQCKPFVRLVVEAATSTKGARNRHIVGEVELGDVSRVF